MVAEMVCVGASVYFHVRYMVPVSDLEDVSQTSEVENIQSWRDGFCLLPGITRIVWRRHNNRGQELQFNLQREWRRVPDWTKSLEHERCLVDVADDISLCVPVWGDNTTQISEVCNFLHLFSIDCNQHSRVYVTNANDFGLLSTNSESSTWFSRAIVRSCRAVLGQELQ